jgi:hypothetical protein
MRERVELVDVSDEQLQVHRLIPIAQRADGISELRAAATASSVDKNVSWFRSHAA